MPHAKIFSYFWSPDDRKDGVMRPAWDSVLSPEKAKTEHAF